MNSDQLIKDQLKQLLEGRNAHLSVEKVINNFPIEYINDHIDGVEYSPWQLLEHMRIAQWDIIDFIQNPDYEYPNWPDDYWPAKDEKATEDMWKESAKKLLEDLHTAIKILSDSDNNLYDPLPHALKYTLLRELFLIADHNAYHLGQMVVLKKIFTK
ncbi:MAG: DinB family protein [Calditrichaceae bacterium]